MFNDGNAPFIAPLNLSKKHVFNYIKKVKNSIPNEELVKGIDKSGNFLKFVNEIFSYGYKDTPNYKKLISFLEQSLTSMNEVNNNEFDWNK